MSGCTTIHAEKACSGKCRSHACVDGGHTLLAAACGGMTALYRQHADGHIAPAVIDTQEAVFSSIDAFQAALQQALALHLLQQLVIVGAENDIAWVHASLSPELAKYVAAEIKYPLMASWFKGAMPATLLQQALQHAMH